MESYDPNCDTWTSIPPMNKHRSAAGVIGVSFDNHVYALGGHDGLSIFDSVRSLRRSFNFIRPIPNFILLIIIFYYFLFF